MKFWETLQMIGPSVLDAVLGVCGCFLLYVFMRLGKWLSAKIEYVNQKGTQMLENAKATEFQDTLNFVTKIIKDIVDALNDTMKKEYLQSSETGKLTEEQKKRLLDKAFNLVLVEISMNYKEILKTGLGDLNEWIRTKIENAVTKSKKKDDKTDDDKFDFVTNTNVDDTESE